MQEMKRLCGMAENEVDAIEAMEKEPFKRAFLHGTSPKPVAKQIFIIYK